MKKNILLVGVIALLVVLLALGTDIQSVDEYYLTHMEDITEDSETVTLSIRCDTVFDNWDKLDKQLRSSKYVPSDGVILPETTYEWLYTCDLGRDVGNYSMTESDPPDTSEEKPARRGKDS